MSYRIVKYRHEHRAEVIELQKHLWSPDTQLNSRYLAWKHERNPYLAGPVIYLVLKNDEVVGMRGFFGTRWEIGNPPQRLTVPYADDALLAPEHRDKGLYSTLMREAFKDLAPRFDFLVNLSAGPITFVSSLANGWQFVGPALAAKKEPHPYQFWKRKLAGKFRRTTGKAGLSKKTPGEQAFMEFDRRAAALTPVGEISVSRSPRTADMANLIERLPYNGRFRHVRDVEYFDWRFQNPLRQYRFIYLDNDTLDGYLVLQSTEPNRIDIVDWEAVNNVLRNNMMDALLKLTRQTELQVWFSTVADSSVEKLQQVGFQPVHPRQGVGRNVPGILTATLSEGGKKRIHKLGLDDMENWDLRMLYSMHG